MGSSNDGRAGSSSKPEGYNLTGQREAYRYKEFLHFIWNPAVRWRGRNVIPTVRACWHSGGNTAPLQIGWSFLSGTKEIPPIVTGLHCVWWSCCNKWWGQWNLSDWIQVHKRDQVIPQKSCYQFYRERAETKKKNAMEEEKRKNLLHT